MNLSIKRKIIIAKETKFDLRFRTNKTILIKTQPLDRLLRLTIHDLKTILNNNNL